MRTPLGLLALLGAFVLSACGGALAGDSCDARGFLCADASTALECRDGTWTALPCRGPGGCVANAVVECDMSRNLEGDLCALTAPSNEGKGICTADGKATLQCRQGTLVKTNDCSSCSVTGTPSNQQVTCKP